MTLTRALREELARRPVDPPAVRDAETAAALRFGGAWTWRGGASGAGWTVTTSVAAVARRLRSALAATKVADPGAEPPGSITPGSITPGSRTPGLEAHRVGGLAREPRWRLVVDDVGVLRALHLVDPVGRPIERPAAPPRSAEAVGELRGALMAAASLSETGRPPHLEVAAPSESAAAALMACLDAFGLPAGHGRHGDAWRVTLKSGETIGQLLARIGAHGTFLAFDEGRLRRQLRDEANRATNAERANLGRAVEAASRQVAAVTAVLDAADGEHLDEGLREVALARLASPGATVSQLAELLETSRTSVHRRLARLEAIAEELRPPPQQGRAGDRDGHPRSQ